MLWPGGTRSNRTCRCCLRSLNLRLMLCCVFADLQKIGGLPVLLSLLRSQHASLRSKAAELVATCVQNNPPVQQVCALFVRHVVCVAEACLPTCFGLRPEGAMIRCACLPGP